MKLKSKYSNDTQVWRKRKKGETVKKNEPECNTNRVS